MKENLNKLLMALGAIQDPIDDEADLSVVAQRISDHFSQEKEPEKKYWYVVFLEISRAGPSTGNIIVDVHPLIWAKKQDQGTILQSNGRPNTAIQVINFMEVSAATVEELKK